MHARRSRNLPHRDGFLIALAGARLHPHLPNGHIVHIHRHDSTRACEPISHPSPVARLVSRGNAGLCCVSGIPDFDSSKSKGTGVRNNGSIAPGRRARDQGRHGTWNPAAPLRRRRRRPIVGSHHSPVRTNPPGAAIAATSIRDHGPPDRRRPLGTPVSAR